MSYHSRNRLGRWLARLASLLAIGLLSQLHAADESTKKFSLPAGRAEMTLRQFSNQAGVELIFSADQVKDIQTNAVDGEFLPAAALDRMVAGTSLVVVRGTQPNKFAVRREATETQAKNAPRAIARDRSDRPANPTANESESQPIKLDTFEVFGRKTLNMDLQRTRDDALPYVVFDSRQIELSQATNLEEFFRKRLTMNAQQQSNSQVVSYLGSSAPGTSASMVGNNSRVDLRGLGEAQTLILVDGRRLPRLQRITDFTQGDINGIPLAAIERVEILPSSAGGIYGGGALGGVINIILKRNYQGLDVTGTYGGTFEGGGSEYRVDLAGGLSLNRGRTNLSFSASQSDAKPLYVGDRDLWRKGREHAVAVNPAMLAFSSSTPNISTSNGTGNLVLDNGVSMNASRTFIPDGYAGVASDNGAALVANAGKFNLELADNATGRWASLRSNPRVRSASLDLRQSLGERLEAFADVAYSDNLGRLVGAVVSPVQSVAAASNPFTSTIMVAASSPNLPNIYSESRVKSRSATAGLIAKLGHEWTAAAEYDWATVKSNSAFTTNAFDTTAFRNAITAGTVNLFRDVAAFPVNYTPYVLTTGFNTFSFLETIQRAVSVRASGPVASLRGHAVTLNVLVESREEEAAPVINLSPLATSSQYIPERRQRNNAGYIEVVMPLVAGADRRPLIHSLELQAAVRHDRYKTSAPTPTSVTSYSPGSALPAFSYFDGKTQSSNPTVGVKWEPGRDFAVRASYATGFMAPSISQIAPTIGPGFVLGGGFDPQDPKRGGQGIGAAVPYTSIAGGNPNLKPEESESMSAGMILAPRFWKSLRLSLDYTRIHKTNEISSPPPQFVLDNESTYPDRVVRGAKLATDPANWAGPITTLDTTFTNRAAKWVQSFDLQADCTQATKSAGEIHAFASITHQTQLRIQDLATTLPYDTVDAYDGPLKWRANGGMDWTFRRWTFGWSAQYYHSYGVRLGNPATAATSSRYLINQGSDRIPSQVYHDVVLSYQFDRRGRSLLSGLAVTAGIQNVFNHYPPVVTTSDNVAYQYSMYADPRLRRFTLSVRKHLGK